MSQRLRNWCFTYNYPQHVNDIDEPESFVPEDARVRFAVWQLERAPETQRLHMQGYIEFVSPIRMGGVKTLVGGERLHLEGRRGSREQAIEYCEKNDSRVDGPWYRGVRESAQGKRSDLVDIADRIKSGTSIFGIVEDYPSQYIRYRRGIEAMHSLYAERLVPKWRDVTVLVYYGAAGSGKTRKAIEESKDDFFILDQGERVWFDGYRGQDTLILDDFYGWIKYGQLLRMLDGHPYRCEIKGGFRVAAWTRVIITSNRHPSEWYSQGLTAALERRITNIEEIN